MKNALMTLLIATMVMFTTHASAESNNANSCIKSKEIHDGFWAGYARMKNICNRPVNVGLCYDSDADYLSGRRCDDDIDFERSLGFPQTYGFSSANDGSDRHHVVIEGEDVQFGACFHPYYPLPAADMKSYECTKCTMVPVDNHIYEEKALYNGKLCRRW